ncbi:MAG: hypothetical protein DBY06_02800 [Clostridiales bacterium]|nr:MAG: hypothetical protein DBY06_02800 [Clostridiales bacterium]
MKRLLAFILVVAMALAFAGSASAFSWEKPAQPTPEEIGYSIDVLKCTLVTGEAGSSYYNVDDNAVAVNGADVYWAVKLTVDNPSNQIKSTAYADVEISGLGLSSVKAIPLSGLDSGVYYFMPSGAGGYFQKIETIIANGGQSPVLATRCTDTQTAKVTAQVYSERVLGEAFNVGDYDVQVRPFLTELKYEAPDSQNCYLRQDYGSDGRQDYGSDGKIYNDTNNKEVLEEYKATGNTPSQAALDAANKSFPDVYEEKNPTAPWNPAKQFRITLSKDGWNFSLQNKNYAYEHIFMIGGYPCIIPATNGASYNAEDLAYMVYEILQSKLGSIRNANGQTIPGLSVRLDPTVYASQTLVILDSPLMVTLQEPDNLDSLVFTFSADPGYDWDVSGNNIPVMHYHASYENDESKQTKLVTFYQAANPVGTGPAIAQFVLNGDRQVQAVITSEAQWNEYFAAYLQGDNDLGDPNSGTGGTYLRVVDQRPTSFLGDMDAIFDLMAWLDEGEIDSIFDAIDAGEMYMTDENLWEALGYAYRFEDSVSWQASTVPIIVDPLA